MRVGDDRPEGLDLVRPPGRLVLRGLPHRPRLERDPGLSYLLVPMDQPGVEARSITQLTRTSEFNEVFFDGARTHVDNVVGEVGEGWRVALATLALSAEWHCWGTSCVSPGARPLDPWPANGPRATRCCGTPGPGPHRTHDHALQHPAQPFGRRRPGRPPEAPSPVYWGTCTAVTTSWRSSVLGRCRPRSSTPRRWHRTRATPSTIPALLSLPRSETIYGGSNQIQRNIIGERVLGLPPEPKGWREHQARCVLRAASASHPRPAGTVSWTARSCWSRRRPGPGIGSATARRCLEEGAAVVVSDAHDRRLGETAEQLRPCRSGGPRPRRACDVTERPRWASSTRRAGELRTLRRGRAQRRSGGHRPAGRDDRRAVVAVLDVTLTGTFRCTRAALSHLLPQGSGVIVNNASVLGWRAQPGQAHYAAAKAGVMALTRCAAAEAAPAGVRVNAVSPSLADTPSSTGPFPTRTWPSCAAASSSAGAPRPGRWPTSSSSWPATTPPT